MSTLNAQFVKPVPFDEERYRQDQVLKNKRFALQLWRVANGGVFVFFAFANYLMRTTQGTWPPPGVARLDATLPAIFSVVLLLAAIPANRVRAAVRTGDPATMGRAIRQNSLITVASGFVFLIGMVLIWQQVHYSGSYSAIFFTMTGFHTLHIVVGMVLLGYVYRNAHTYTRENHWSLEGTVIFWNFLELMWVFYLLVLYVL